MHLIQICTPHYLRFNLPYPHCSKISTRNKVFWSILHRKGSLHVCSYILFGAMQYKSVSFYGNQFKYLGTIFLYFIIKHACIWYIILYYVLVTLLLRYPRFLGPYTTFPIASLTINMYPYTTFWSKIQKFCTCLQFNKSGYKKTVLHHIQKFGHLNH